MIFVFLFFLFASFSVFFVSSTLLFCHIYFVIIFNKYMYLVVQCDNRNCLQKVITILVGYYNFGCHSVVIIRKRNLCKLKGFSPIPF